MWRGFSLSVNDLDWSRWLIVLRASCKSQRIERMLPSLLIKLWRPILKEVSSCCFITWRIMCFVNSPTEAYKGSHRSLDSSRISYSTSSDNSATNIVKDGYQVLGILGSCLSPLGCQAILRLWPSQLMLSQIFLGYQFPESMRRPSVLRAFCETGANSKPFHSRWLG